MTEPKINPAMASVPHLLTPGQAAGLRRSSELSWPAIPKALVEMLVARNPMKIPGPAATWEDVLREAGRQELIAELCIIWLQHQRE